MGRQFHFADIYKNTVDILHGAFVKHASYFIVRHYKAALWGWHFISKDACMMLKFLRLDVPNSGITLSCCFNFCAFQVPLLQNISSAAFGLGGTNSWPLTN
jgi:hypothetical protein